MHVALRQARELFRELRVIRRLRVFPSIRREPPVFDLCGVNFSKGYIAVGSTLPSPAVACNGIISGINIAGNIAHNSRRVTVIVSPLSAFKVKREVRLDSSAPLKLKKRTYYRNLITAAVGSHNSSGGSDLGSAVCHGRFRHVQGDHLNRL